MHARPANCENAGYGTSVRLTMKINQHPKTISHCGHADASITLNWYAHAMPGNDEQAANLLAAVMEHPEKAAKTA